jgi:citrate synthase
LIEASAGIVELGRQVVVHGLDLHHDCLAMSLFEYTAFATLGRQLPPPRVRILERIFIATGYPDARIWCNRIAGYLGSARVDPGYMLAAAIAASDSVAYGFRAIRAAYDAQAAIPEPLDERDRWLTAALVEHRLLAGYGRPMSTTDERIGATLAILAEAGERAGPALRRAFWLHDRLVERKGIELNAAGAWAAVAIDFGLSRAEFETLSTLVFAPGYLAVYSDQLARPPLAFLHGHQSR